MCSPWPGCSRCPPTAAAQNDGGFASEPPTELVPYTRFAVTPWVGFRVPYGSGDYFVFTEDGTSSSWTRTAAAARPSAWTPRTRCAARSTWWPAWRTSRRDQNELNVIDEDGNLRILQSNGPEVWFLKAGVQYRLPDPIPDNRRFHPAAYVTVAPALVFMDWPEFDGVRQRRRERQHAQLRAQHRRGRGDQHRRRAGWR